MYQQIDGVAIGSPLGPMLANIFVGFHEKQLFNKINKPCCYLRYVNDTFTSFSSLGKAEEIFSQFNNLHPFLKYTMEIEENNQLPFLDVPVGSTPVGFLTSVYRKPTFSGLYLTWDSFAPRSRKINLIRTRTHCALMLCSKCRLDAELKKLKQLLLMNSYPECFLTATTEQKINKFNESHRYSPSKCPVYLRLPRVGTGSQIYADRIVNSI